MTAVIFEDEKKLCGAKFLVQGTIAPDWIESGGGERDVIKSHHNVGGLPSYLKLPLIEPLNSLFKDEVRKIGLSLGLPKTLIGRHPFPGPGLGVRIIGEITKEKTKILQDADHIFIEELIKADLYHTVSQAFAVLLPVKSVGVMGDERTYNYSVSLRAITSVDGMTADFYMFTNNQLKEISSRIINNVKGINRVLYDFTSKPPGTIEWE